MSAKKTRKGERVARYLGVIGDHAKRGDKVAATFNPSLFAARIRTFIECST